MDGKSLISNYEKEVAAIIDDLIIQFKKKYPGSMSGDRNSKRYLVANRILEFELHSMAINYIEEFEGHNSYKSGIWESLKTINYKHLIEFKNQLDPQSAAFKKK